MNVVHIRVLHGIVGIDAVTPLQAPGDTGAPRVPVPVCLGQKEMREPLAAQLGRMLTTLCLSLITEAATEGLHVHHMQSWEDTEPMSLPHAS